VNEAVAEAGHLLEPAPERRVDNAGFTQHGEDIAVVARPAQALARDHVMANVKAGFDGNLQFALGGMLLERRRKKLLASHVLEPRQVAQLLADFRYPRRDELAVYGHRSEPAAAC